MGVPAFFRWLSNKYPSICTDINPNVAVDYTFDNLYLDMNGIIHPCTHPEYKKPPETEMEMFEAIFEYIEKLMKILRPKKLLYMAVDGVAPRAKMNQQRSRRFRASKESIVKKEEINQVRERLKARGVICENDEKDHFDCNVITPGTQFMTNLSIALQTWIDKKLDHSRKGKGLNIWHKDLLVILSDASAPGEGEHKIMEFIRQQRSQENYDSNLSHCLCGADADLIMLGLATHELNFTIIREEFVPNQQKPCDLCGQYDHEVKDCEGKSVDPLKNCIKRPSEPGFLLIRLSVFRNYLDQERGNLDLERFIDDFVFLCFFVGNDFLPHLPSLEICEGAIDRLMQIYKRINAKYPDKDIYLTKNGIVNLKRCQLILRELGHVEDAIFLERARKEDARNHEKGKEQKMSIEFQERKKMNKSRKTRATAKKCLEADDVFWQIPETEKVELADIELITKALRSVSTKKKEPGKKSSAFIQAAHKKHEEKAMKVRTIDDKDHDAILLGVAGWKDRYYLHKFDSPEPEKIGRIISREYVIGLCWVLLYYYQGCPDWQWFYPFHYAPFASDFVDIEQIEIKFNRKSKPFKPLEQLMSVFPAASSSNLPQSWRKLMSDPTSPIIDFYPENFKIDLNGKKFEWQGVALLPFIDETRLHSALESVYPDLSEDEKDRNTHGPHLFFVSKRKKNAYQCLDKLFDKSSDSLKVPSTLFNEIFGEFRLSLKSSHLHKNSRCVEFYDPCYPEDYIFPSIRLPGAKTPPAVLKTKGTGNNKFKPMVGISQSKQKASLTDSTHRFANHHTHNGQNGHAGSVNGNRGGHTTHYHRGAHRAVNHHVRSDRRGVDDDRGFGPYQQKNQERKLFKNDYYAQK